MRLFALFLGLAVLFLVPFLIWGSAWEAAFSLEGAAAWLQGFETWGWLAGLTLMAADLFLPIPGTVVISALGLVYGPVWGGLIGAAGAFLAGSMAYWLCRQLGQKAARFLLGERDFERGEQFFGRVGGLVVAFSRWLPLLPEVIACMAGLVRMPAATFHLALACGALPLGLAFGYIGSMGIERPMLTLVLSAVAPVFLWLGTQMILRRLAQNHSPRPV